jgi:hypothetical protein
MLDTTSAALIRDLGDGLILRCATPADADALAAFNSRIHSDTDEPDLRIAAWTRDLLTRPHPTFAPADFTIIEHTPSSRIVSSLNLISQDWAYAGIPFGVGRPEVVGTLPEFRNRGLVRTQFELIHQWSAARDQLVQVITGIPFYYRQFDYEMGLALSGGRSGFAPDVPRLKDGQAEPYLLRPAQPADIPFLEAVHAATVARRDLLTAVRTPALWRYELDGRSPDNLIREEVRLITTAAGEPVGYLVHHPTLWEGPLGTGLAALAYELNPGVSLLAVTPSVIRYLWSTGAALAAAAQKTQDRFAFALGAEHPVYDAYRDRLPRVRPPYAWYVRVPDLPAFLRRIAPALEAHLAASAAVGHTGELKLNFYRRGLRLVLEQGRLVTIEPWQPPVGEGGDAAFPNHTFLQLLFGYRSLDELQAAYADCYSNGDETRVLLSALFPRQASNVWGIA